MVQNYRSVLCTFLLWVSYSGAVTLTKDQDVQLGCLAMQIGSESWELVHVYQGDKIKVLSTWQQKQVLAVKNSIDLLLENVSMVYHNGDQKQAVDMLTKGLVELCTAINAGGGRYYVDQSVKDNLATIATCVKALIKCYKTICPQEPFFKWLEQKLLYNTMSTEVVPQGIWWAGKGMMCWGTAWCGLDLLKTKGFQPIHKLWAYVARLAKIEVADVPINELTPHMIVLKNFYKPVLLLGASYLMHTLQWQKYQERLKRAEKQIDKATDEVAKVEKGISYEREVDFSTLKGLADLKVNDLGLVVDYLKNPFKYTGIQKKGTFTVLLYGPPGTGKTLSARAIAKESGAPFVEINADDIFSDQAKDKIMVACEVAKAAAACRPEKSAIIYIDELDCVSTNRDNFANGLAPDADRAKALANLLTLLDGVHAANPYLHIVIIMTTNHWKSLDPALMRPGRIDRKIGIGFPDEQTRYEFIKSLISHPMPEADLRDLAQKTEGYTGAYMVNMVNGAKLQARYAHKVMPVKADYEVQIARISSEIEATAVRG